MENLGGGGGEEGGKIPCEFLSRINRESRQVRQESVRKQLDPFKRNPAKDSENPSRIPRESCRSILQFPDFKKLNIFIQFVTILSEIFQGCSKDFQRILIEFSKDAPKMLQEFPRDVPKMLRGFSKDAPRMLQGCSKDAPRMLQRCSKDAPKMLQKCSKDAPRMLQGCSKDAPRMLQGILLPIHHKDPPRDPRCQTSGNPQPPQPDHPERDSPRQFSRQESSRILKNPQESSRILKNPPDEMRSTASGHSTSANLLSLGFSHFLLFSSVPIPQLWQLESANPPRRSGFRLPDANPRRCDTRCNGGTSQNKTQRTQQKIRARN